MGVFLPLAKFESYKSLWTGGVQTLHHHGNENQERRVLGVALLKLRVRGLKSTNERGPTLVAVRWAFRAGTRDFCPALATLVDPGQNIVFLTVHYFDFVHIVQQAGHAVMLGRLSLSMRL